MQSLGHARILLLVRNVITITKLDQYMDQRTATIWVRIGNGKNNSVVVGGLYREHSQLGQQDLNSTWLEKKEEQEQRWNLIVNNWRQAATNPRCLVIGDFNLDHLRWRNPDQFNENMVTKVQEQIEVLGFTQMISGYTRRWRNQSDSLLDQIWSNCQHRVIRHFNQNRGESDHNLIGLEIATKDIMTGGSNVVKRSWKNFSTEICSEKFRLEDWSSILEEDNLDRANTILEEKIGAILDSEAQMVVQQIRVGYHNWITDNTKLEMEIRDTARNRAKESDTDRDWAFYRMKRNYCSSLQKRTELHTSNLCTKKWRRTVTPRVYLPQLNNYLVSLQQDPPQDF